MKTLIGASFLALFSFVGVQSAEAGVVTDTIRVTSMQCGMCESRIEKSLQKADFINAVEADVESEIVVVTYDASKSNKGEIEKLIALTGYDTENLAADADAQNALHGCCKPGAHKKESAAPAKKQVKKATSH